MEYVIHITTGEVYYTQSYSHTTEGKRLDGSGVEMVEFTPTNGRDKGKVHKIPLARIDRFVILYQESLRSNEARVHLELAPSYDEEELRDIWRELGKNNSGDFLAWAFVNRLLPNDEAR